MAIRLQIRRDTEANWIEANTVLAQGEVIEVLPSGNTPARFKIGDGVTAYNNLPFIEISWGEITGDLANQTDLQNALDGKVDELSSPATAGTYTKVTINSDGLVSSGATLSASDIPDISATYYLASNPEGYTSNVGTVTSVNNVEPVNGNVTIEIPDSATWGNITGDIADQTDLSTALGNKVDKTSTANKVYGTDANGDQTTYDVDSFGQVDDVTVGGTSVVTNKVAVLGTMAGETASDYATAAQGALADSAVQTVNNIQPVNGNVTLAIPTDTSDLTNGAGYITESDLPTAGTGLRLNDNNEMLILQQDYGSNPIPNIVGTLTNVQDRIYTGFSDNNYFEFANPLVLSGTDSYEMQFCYRCPVSSTTTYGLFYFGNNIYGVQATATRYARSSVYLPSAATYTFDITNDGSTFTTLNIKRTVDSQNNTFTDLIRTSDNYGQTWTTVEERTYSGALDSRTATLRLGTGLSHGLNETGRINLDYCFIKVNGEDWWNPSAATYKPVAKATNNLYGLVKPDNLSITVNDGVISASITNNVTSTSTTSALSANMGKELQEQITHLQGIGRFLALWDCSTGLAETNPPVSPYTYKTGDYFIVGTVATGSGTNYKPSGSSYITGTASTTVETETVKVGYVYYYDGTTWRLQPNEAGTVTDVQVAGTSVVTSGVANIQKASNSSLGVVMGSNSGGTQIGTDGSVRVYSASNAHIDAKTSIYLPIVPSTLDYAVKVSVTTNTNTLTTAEQTSARTWIGAGQTTAVFVDWSE